MPSSNALDPQSPLARAIYDLGIVSCVAFALIFVIVTGAITFSIFRFRARAGEPDPTQTRGNPPATRTGDPLSPGRAKALAADQRDSSR